MKTNKYIIYIIIIFNISFFANLNAKKEDRIYGKHNPSNKVINFGPTYEDEKINSAIIWEYYGDERTVIRNGEPTIKVVKHSFDNRQFPPFEYKSFNPDTLLPLYMEKGKDTIIAIPFYFKSDIADYGWYHAKAIVGLTSVKDSTLIITDTLTLKGKRTSHFIAGMQDTVNFDSVYVNPALAKVEKWNVKNVYKDNLTISGEEYKYLSPVTTKMEFSTQDFETTPIFTKKNQIIEWSLRYTPVNLGADSALFSLVYDKTLNNITISDSSKVKLFGIGVAQELQLIKSNFSFSGDTIDIGNVTKGYKTEIIGVLQNIGNIPFGAKNEKLINGIDNTTSQVLTMDTTTFKDNYLHPKDTIRFKLNCQIDELGVFIDKYEIESDILDRDIFGVPGDKIKKTIIIRGVGSAPQLRLPADTIDFGNVVINDIYCPTQKDTTIYIENTGNAQLIIQTVSLSPDKYFSYELTEYIIEPGNGSLLKISFLATDSKKGKFQSTMIFNTNDNTTEYKLVLIAIGIPREKSWLAIPKTITAQPGKIVNVPIILEDKYFHKHHLQYAKNFLTEISYDSTILRYKDRINLNTASEISEIGINEINSGKLLININNSIDYFLKKDTLIILQFKSYLGEKESTSIAFSSSITKFGDGLCDNVLDIDENITNGLFTTDSVCGLNLKISKLSINKINIIEISPNPANQQININFSTENKAELIIIIANINGDIIQNITEKEFNRGNYNIVADISNIPQGTYIVILKDGISLKTKQIVIIK